jgi:hypothetical protein
MPYSLVKALRSKVGRALSQGTFQELPEAQLSRLYGALSADIEIAAARTSPEALTAVRNANARWSEIKREQELLASVLEKHGGPEKVFQGLMATTQTSTYGGGATVINQVLASIDPATRMHLAASALYRMGRATKGAQEAFEGKETFSAATFLTNWEGMDKAARAALFDNLPGNYSAELTKLGNNIAALKQYQKLLPNPSGTTHAWWAAAELNTFIAALLTGRWKTAGGVAAAYMGAKTAAAALTHPESVRYLSEVTGQIATNVAKGTVAVASQPSEEDLDMPAASEFSDLTR